MLKWLLKIINKLNNPTLTTAGQLMLPGFLLFICRLLTGIRNEWQKTAEIRNHFCGFIQLPLKAGMDKLGK